MKSNVTRLRRLLSNFDHFSIYCGLIHLRPYQLEAARAVLRSIFAGDGETFVWKFARQGGKDETLAALCQYLLTLYCHRDISIVVAAPTFKPQVEIAMHRLRDRLTQNIVLKKEWAQHLGYTCHIRRARILFFSADPSANVVGATASPLLIINEAQDVLPSVYDKRFAPMAAANNATRLFSGTAWTRDTLLAREERTCRLKEQRDGLRRLFIVDGPSVARAHPPYGRFLESEIARLGPDHPIVVSQYLCREIDSHIGMFNAARRALIFSHFPLHFRSKENGDREAWRSPGGAQSDQPSSLNSQPIQGHVYAFCIDVAGQDELSSGASVRDYDDQPAAAVHSTSFPFTVNGQPPTSALLLDPRAKIDNSRDSTTLSIVDIDLSTLDLLHAPTYRVVQRHAWTGQNHLTVFGKLKALAEIWRPQHIVIDATGVGEGLWALLDKTFPTRVIPVKFTASTKSEIGYRFLAIIETGRFHDIATADYQRSTVDRQYTACQSEVLIGPQKIMRWGVPDGTRDENGELIHDDFVLADALTAILDQLEWRIRFETFIIPGRDPLDEMTHFK
jgi:terminase large subunit-like protein